MSTETLNLTTVQTVSLAIFCFLVVILGLMGNITVLYASLRHNALKLDKVSLIFIHNLAVADIWQTVIMALPTFATYSTRSWVLGRVWCFVHAHLPFAPGAANCLLVLVITLHRVVLFTVPNRAISTRTATICSVLIWSVAVVVPATTFVINRAKSNFYSDLGVCVSSVVLEKPILFIVNVVLLTLLPLVLITLTNFAICFIAINHSTRRDEVRSSITLTCLLSGFFIVSWLPYVVRTIYAYSVNSLVPQELELLAYNCVSINSFVNPILYSFTNPTFRKYMLGVVSNIGQRLNWRTPRNQLEEDRMRNIQSTSV